MTVAILSIGTELTRGEIVDTNSAWLAAALTEAGFDVGECDTVADDAAQIVRALQRLAAEHATVLCSGGLGPTTDDITARCASEAAGVPLTRNDEALAAIRRRVESRGRTVTPHHEKQADIPTGAELLPNSEGTAPGFAVRIGASTAFFMPGVPREMQRMFPEQVLPRIRPSAPNNAWVVRLRTFGLAESSATQLLDGLEAAHEGVTLGYRIHFPEVDVKVLARSTSQSAAREVACRAAAEAKERLGDVVYGEADDTLPDITARELRVRGYRLAIAESCTGGLISHLLTTSPGASEYLIGSAVTYANSAKTRLLGVSEDTLRGHGAVSAEVAAEMAEGVRRLCETNVGVAVTGIAGPGGGSAEKPVGLVYWAVAHPGGTIVKDRVFSGSRGEIQSHAAHSALDTLRRVTAGLPDEPAIPPPRSRR
ncbi:MAG: CinA family nicotinamide mononucleotide deamidase-related protein [Polyangiaceae bacterium]